MECKSCGAPIPNDATQCPYCSATVARPPFTGAYPGAVPGNIAPPVPAGVNNKIAAGICGIVLGALGIHKFILGYTRAGVITLCITIFSFGFGGFVMWLFGVIEGIIYLTRTDEEFYQTYVLKRKEWF